MWQAELCASDVVPCSIQSSAGGHCSRLRVDFRVAVPGNLGWWAIIVPVEGLACLVLAVMLREQPFNTKAAEYGLSSDAQHVVLQETLGFHSGVTIEPSTCDEESVRRLCHVHPE